MGFLPALPLTATVDAQVHTIAVSSLALVATIASSRVVAGPVRSVPLARSGVAGSVTIFVNIVRITVLTVGVLVLLQGSATRATLRTSRR